MYTLYADSLHAHDVVKGDLKDFSEEKDLLKLTYIHRINGNMKPSIKGGRLILLSLCSCLSGLKCGSQISSSWPTPLTATKVGKLCIRFPGKSKIFFFFVIVFRPAARPTQAEGFKRVELHLYPVDMHVRPLLKMQ